MRTLKNDPRGAGYAAVDGRPKGCRMCRSSRQACITLEEVLRKRTWKSEFIYFMLWRCMPIGSVREKTLHRQGHGISVAHCACAVLYAVAQCLFEPSVQLRQCKLARTHQDASHTLASRRRRL